MKGVAGRIRAVRVRVFGERGKNKLCHAMPMGYRRYENYEWGITNPDLIFVDSFCLLTGCPLLWLIRGEPESFRVEELAPYGG